MPLVADPETFRAEENALRIMKHELDRNPKETFFIDCESHGAACNMRHRLNHARRLLKMPELYVMSFSIEPGSSRIYVKRKRTAFVLESSAGTKIDLDLTPLPSREHLKEQRKMDQEFAQQRDESLEEKLARQAKPFGSEGGSLFEEEKKVPRA